MPQAVRRIRLTYRGTVQGVGFRPTVYRCARSLRLAGFVRNERSAVVVEIQGEDEAVAAFPAALAAMLPGAAQVQEVTHEEIEPASDAGELRIEESVPARFTIPPIPPDLAICPDCARELLDPGNRRYLYPFITCTQCGPRYSITRETPFDREHTSMSHFAQCPECAAEYADPRDRRFHSQTNSCPRCGPHLDLRDGSGASLPGDPLIGAIDALARGSTVALLGIGGFHLAADPSRPGAVERLRADKRRERKPFALMVRDLEVARRLCAVDAGAEALLRSPASPIVILPLAPGAPEHLGLVSGTGTLGIMLPYSPLHLLLFRRPGAAVPYDHLIMTSGNLRDEPIIAQPEQGTRELRGVADLFLVHDRLIVFRTDDSVLRPAPGGPAILFRRSRGAVPGLLRLARPLPEPCLAVGGDLKNAPALALGGDLFLAPYLGDLESLPAFDVFVAQIRGMLELYGVQPRRLLHDFHPGYRSTRWALEQADCTPVAVQHHHAHILSVMAEHGLEEALGLAFDGTGYGTDGTIWGGELLHATRAGFSRLGSFAPFRLPGGEAAILHPARIAFSVLREAWPAEADLLPLRAEERSLVSGMLGHDVSCPTTSSLGRLFDAAAAALGLVERVSYEGEGPMLLEGLAARARGLDARSPELERLVPLARGESDFTLDAAPLLARLASGGSPPDLAFLFHRAIADAALRGAREMRSRTGLSLLAASGGVFQNALLRGLLFPALEREGFTVYTNLRLPPGDGGLAAGQAWYTGDFQAPA